MPSKLIKWKCLCCGLAANVPADARRIACACGFVQLSLVPGLGDYAAAALHCAGITQARYLAVKAALGLPRKCGCAKRQQKLNELGKKLGIGAAE